MLWSCHSKSQHLCTCYISENLIKSFSRMPEFYPFCYFYRHTCCPGKADLISPVAGLWPTCISGIALSSEHLCLLPGPLEIVMKMMVMKSLPVHLNIVMIMKLTPGYNLQYSISSSYRCSVRLEFSVVGDHAWHTNNNSMTHYIITDSDKGREIPGTQMTVLCSAFSFVAHDRCHRRSTASLKKAHRSPSVYRFKFSQNYSNDEIRVIWNPSNAQLPLGKPNWNSRDGHWQSIPRHLTLHPITQFASLEALRFWIDFQMKNTVALYDWCERNEWLIAERLHKWWRGLCESGELRTKENYS